MKPATDPPKTVPAKAAGKSPKGSGGAPTGNTNRAKDPKFTLAMREAQRVARRNRRRRHRAHYEDAKAIVRECGLADSPLAETIARRVGQIEAEIEELDQIVQRVGRTKRDGNLNPAYERRLNLISTDRVELRQLLDRFVELRASLGGPERNIVYKVRIDGFDPGATVCPHCGEIVDHELTPAATGGAGRQDEVPAAPVPLQDATEPVADVPVALEPAAVTDEPMATVTRIDSLAPGERSHPPMERENLLKSWFDRVAGPNAKD